jgi:hypothetical protein
MQTFDTAVGKVLARIKVFALALAKMGVSYELSRCSTLTDTMAMTSRAEMRRRAVQHTL